ncbi:hypothetical protein JCM3765_000048 [Sporobolomyces pararoseus]
MSWIWDGNALLSEMRWLVEEAPLPLFALLRERVAVARYIHAVERAKTRLTSYLSDSPISNLSPRARRARVLVNWLHSDGDKRWERFFGGSGSETIQKGEEPWDWGFYDLVDAELERERSVEELEEWEQKEIEWENRRN